MTAAAPAPPPTKRRIPHDQASRLAQGAVRLLAPACERICIAGSLRRKQATIGDIELVVVPKVTPWRDLLGQEIEGLARNHLNALVADLLRDGTLATRPDVHGRIADGNRYKRLLYRPSRGAEPFALDLFAVLPPAQYGLILTIRTGCADFSHKLVTPQVQGGWLPAGMRVWQGCLWREGAVIETPEEGDVFSALGLPFLHPWHRQPYAQLQRRRGGSRVWVGFERTERAAQGQRTERTGV